MKDVKEKNCQGERLLYPAKVSVKNEGGNKIFPDKQKMRKFVASRPVLQDMLKGVLQAESMLDNNLKLPPSTHTCVHTYMHTQTPVKVTT